VTRFRTWVRGEKAVACTVRVVEENGQRRRERTGFSIFREDAGKKDKFMKRKKNAHPAILNVVKGGLYEGYALASGGGRIDERDQRKRELPNRLRLRVSLEMVTEMEKESLS